MFADPCFNSYSGPTKQNMEVEGTSSSRKKIELSFKRCINIHEEVFTTVFARRRRSKYGFFRSGKIWRRSIFGSCKQLIIHFWIGQTADNPFLDRTIAHGAIEISVVHAYTYIHICGHVKLSLLNSADNSEYSARKVGVRACAASSAPAGSALVGPSIEKVRTNFFLNL